MKSSRYYSDRTVKRFYKVLEHVLKLTAEGHSEVIVNRPPNMTLGSFKIAFLSAMNYVAANYGEKDKNLQQQAIDFTTTRRVALDTPRDRLVIRPGTRGTDSFADLITVGAGSNSKKLDEVGASDLTQTFDPVQKEQEAKDESEELYKWLCIIQEGKTPEDKSFTLTTSVDDFPSTVWELVGELQAIGAVDYEPTEDDSIKFFIP